MKKVILILIVAVAVGCGVYYWKYKLKDPKANNPKFSLAKVERGSITLDVATTGKVVANLDVDIKCKASGRVVTLPYDVSNAVTSGTLLLELDPVDEQRQLKQSEVALSASEARLAQSRQNLVVAEKNLETEKRRAEAALKSAEARAADARAKADRMKQLLEKTLASQEEYDTAETGAVQAATELENAKVRLQELQTQELALEVRRQDVRLAEAEVETDKIALSNSMQRLKDTKVYSPLDGVVAVRNVQIGQIIASGVSNVGGGTTLMTLSDLSHIYVLASVDESDIGKIAVGQSATITADAYPGQIFSGKVVRIATRGVAVSNVVTFEVKIEVVSENKSLLKPEMTTNIEIVAVEKEDVPLVPAEAVSRRGPRTFALVMNDDGTSTPRPIEIGITNGFQVEIASGLEEGETVVVRRGEMESRWRGRGGPGGPGGPGGTSGRMMMMGGGGGMRGGPRR